jgi:hypothetical protein
VRQAKAFFNAPTFDCEDLKRFAITEHVTHVVAKRKQINASCTFARVIFKKSGVVILELDARAE